MLVGFLVDFEQGLIEWIRVWFEIGHKLFLIDLFPHSMLLNFAASSTNFFPSLEELQNYLVNSKTKDFIYNGHQKQLEHFNWMKIRILRYIVVV